MSIRRTSGIAARVLLAGSSFVALAPALAQTAASADGEPGDIVVTASRPIAESEAAALLVQRNSDNLIAVAAADAVGRLPDQNIAQAASRLPGVAIERDQGQPRYINLRGAPARWSTLSFDGLTIVSPEGRETRYDSIPSALAGRIEVVKAVTPEFTGETIAGNVNIVTRSPFDYDGFRLMGKLGYGKGELGGRPEYEGSLILSNTYETGIGEIGVLIGGSYYERNMITDNFETDWEQVGQDQRPGFADRYWARETENKLYRLTRRNWSLSSRIEWRPDTDNKVSFTSLYSIFTDDEARDNYIFDLDDRQGDLSNANAPCATTVNPTPTTTGYADVCIGNTPFRGTVYGIDINQRATLRAFRQSVFTNTLAGDHRFGDVWRVRWAANYTESIDDRSVVGEARFESPSTRTLRPTVEYDFTDPGLHQVRLFSTNQLASPNRFERGTFTRTIDGFTKPLSQFRVLDAVDVTSAWTGRLEIGRDINLFGGEGIIRLGAQYDRRTKEANESEILVNTAAGFTTIGVPTDYNAFSLNTPFAGDIPLGYNFRYFDEAQTRAAAGRARASFARTPIPGNFYNVREEIYAAYLMANSRFDWGSVVGGVRMEHVKNNSRANATIPGVVGQVSASSSSTLFFPSLHLNFNLADDKKLRIGFTSGAARGDYDQLRPNVVVNDTDQTISGGNPALKPERAYGVDAYLEWYVQSQGYFMLGAFYKRVEDALFNSTRTFGSTALNTGGIDRSGYRFSGLVNGGAGYLYGLEAAAQLQLDPYTERLGLPEWMGGFGINANVTLNKSEVEKPPVFAGATQIVAARKLRLPGSSDVVYNLGLYYEKYGFSARLQYQLRTERLDDVADTLVDAGDTYWDTDTELDFSMRYEIKKGFEVFFDASNLLNQPGRRYVDLWQQDKRRTIEWERFGRRYAGGVRVTF